MLRHWKRFLIKSLILTVFSSCSSTTVRLFQIQADRGGLVSADGTVLPFEKSDAFFCVSPDDFEVLLYQLQMMKAQNP